MNAPEPIPFKSEGPQPLIREAPAASLYPVAALGPLMVPADALARATEAPLALCAGSVLAAASLAVQGLRDVQTLGGARPVSLFLLTVAESGERKSTADRLAMRGVRTFEGDLRQDYDDARASWSDAKEVWERQRGAILKRADKNPDTTRADLAALGPQPQPPLRPQIVTGAATMEGIVKNLPELRASLGIMTDEGGLLLGGHSMKAENKLATLATLAAMWDGSTLDRWRAGDGIAAHEGRRFSAHLLIQPSAAEAFLADPLANGQGLLARFLTCQPQSRIGYRDRMAPDANAEAELDRFADRITALLGRDLALAEGRRNELAPPVLPLSREARALLEAFARETEWAQAPGRRFENCRAFASKAAEHAARLAAVLALYADPDAPEVTAEAMANGIDLARFYLEEAARVQNAAVIPPHIADAERMRRWLLGSWEEDCISVKVAANRGPFKITERTRNALRLLEKYKWLIEEPGAVVDGAHRREAWRVVRP
ncbi:YfjI family protein [Marimonas lutisalis]|uniref:YfjI family protein n=1 Tax=Marimonas lutisalis TaxID=2545756 RepID=UPI0010F5D261|nr:YfjI family protein [Marimonas lutisalis]